MRLLLAVACAAALHVQPDPTLTPGATCATTDPDFDHIAHYPRGDVVLCRRHVTAGMKRQLFASYGVPLNRQGRYETDHLVPLCAGGSNSFLNLWPEPWADADRKDVLEKRACAGLRAGRLTQQQAIALVLGP